MVSNDMPSAPSSRAWCSSSAATSISRSARPDKAQNVLEELAAHQRRLNHQRQLVFILHPAQRLDQRRGQRR